MADHRETSELLGLGLPKAEALVRRFRPQKSSDHVRLLKGLGVVGSQRDGRMVMDEPAELGSAVVRSCRASGVVA